MARPAVLVLCVIGLACAGPVAAWADGSRAGVLTAGPGIDPCADLGSFAVVDAPPPPRGAPLRAQSYSPCADLPATQPQPFIDIQVQLTPRDHGRQPNRPDGPATPGGPVVPRAPGMPMAPAAPR